MGLPAPDARISVSPTTLVAEGHSLVGSYLGSSLPRRDIPRFIDLWRTGRLPIDRLVSSRLPLSGINAALDRLAGFCVEGPTCKLPLEAAVRSQPAMRRTSRTLPPSRRRRETWPSGSKPYVW